MPEQSGTKVLPEWAKDMTPEEQAEVLADIPDWDDEGDVVVLPARRRPDKGIRSR